MDEQRTRAIALGYRVEWGALSGYGFHFYAWIAYAPDGEIINGEEEGSDTEADAWAAVFEHMEDERMDETIRLILVEVASRWQDDHMWDEYTMVVCRYCKAEANEHPCDTLVYDLAGVEVEHAPDCVIARINQLLEDMT